MSKSVGNVVNPFDAMEMYGRDPLRWYMAYDGGIVDDSDYSNASISARYQTLKNGLGNFASRLTRSKNWNIAREIARTFDRGTQKDVPNKVVEKELFDTISTVRAEVERAMDQANPRLAAHAIDRLVGKANVSFTVFAPWKLGVKDDYDAFPSEGREGIYLSAETLRICGILLQPFMPDKANVLLQTLGVKPERRTLDYAEVGADGDYGESPPHEGVLFPPIPTYT
jgi:methionyl-tRNA synthetase